MPKTVPVSPPLPSEALLSRAKRQQRLQESKDDFKKRMKAIEKITSVPEESESESSETDLPLPSPPHSPPHNPQNVLEEKEAEQPKKDDAQAVPTKTEEEEVNPQPSSTNEETRQEEVLPTNVETAQGSHAKT